MKLGFSAIAGPIAIITVASAWFLLNRPESASHEQSTDDAYIQADITVVAPQISGRITQVVVTDYQEVQAGQTLLQIDDRPFRFAVARSTASVASTQATLDRLNAQLVQQNSLVAQAQAAVDLDRVNLHLADADQLRFGNMARDGSGTRQSAEQADTHFKAQQAILARDQAALASTEQQIAIIQADIQQAQANLDAVTAERDTALLNLSYTTVIAPVSGVVTQRKARVGGFTQAGEAQLALIPLDDIYVEANFRETQLTNIRAGQRVTLHVDSYPDLNFGGTVLSLAPASDAIFSPVAAHNATGNFTKITQRLPVRIAIHRKPDQPRLSVGMSVVATITTQP